MTLTSLNWGLHQHILPTGPGAPFKLGTGPSVSASATVEVCSSPAPSQLCPCLPVNAADPEPDLPTSTPSGLPPPDGPAQPSVGSARPVTTTGPDPDLHTWLDLRPASPPGTSLMIWTCCPQVCPAHFTGYCGTGSCWCGPCPAGSAAAPGSWLPIH